MARNLQFRKLNMLWEQYVFRRGEGVHKLWEKIHAKRSLRIIYIAGRGFDVRAQKVMNEYVGSLIASGANVESAELALVGFAGYELSDEMKELTEENAIELEKNFSALGTTRQFTIGASDPEDGVTATNALRESVSSILDHIDGKTDIVLDVSSLPRVAYLAILMSILSRLIKDRNAPDKAEALYANGVNFQVLVAEDAELDGHIKAEDPSNELVQMPGFTAGFHLESAIDWPLVWFPILGENRVNQLAKVLSSSGIPDEAEICPVVPHPSKNPRRADNLLVEYEDTLFKNGMTPTSNIVYVHESNPFEAYRQLLGAMTRFQRSMNVLGRCRLVVTPLSSKLVTVGAGLACFEMGSSSNDHLLAIPLAEPKRYIALPAVVKKSKPEISVLLLTGDAFQTSSSM